MVAAEPLAEPDNAARRGDATPMWASPRGAGREAAGILVTHHRRLGGGGFDAVALPAAPHEPKHRIR
ncbi:MAG: hypothetical protein HZC37_28255 [Burkholderiales bacterium]|nr:hypothetical protein [Burkholderiales bacterium]